MTRIDPAPADYDITVPLAIVGGGAAGLIAALTAQAEGVAPLVIERDKVPRGSTALSAGLVPAAGTRWQRAHGIEDTPARFAADIRTKAAGLVDADAVDAVTRAVGPALEWLGDAHGLDFSVITDFNYPGHSVHRMHGLASRSGEELIDRLREAAEQSAIDLLLNAHATALHADPDGRVTGLSVTRPDGSVESIGCAALILCCNGYGGAKELVRRHIPSLADALYFGHPGNQGDALLWGERLGAAVRDLSGHQGHGSVAHPAGILITWATMTEGGVQVNLDGLRFADESHGYSEAAAPVLAQRERVAWTIFDERIAGISRQFADFQQAEAAGAVLRADDVDGLASATKLPAATLAATLAEVAAAKAAGATDRFGRCFKGVPALTPPYRAVRVTGALFHTQGGLVVDGEARVLRQDGSPLPNLFAAGGAAAGVSGPEASGYLSGNGLLMAVGLGRLAGKAAAGLVRG